jgi:hypothetical protein
MQTTQQRTTLALAVVLLATSLAHAQGTYTEINYPGSYNTACEGIDSAGDVVGFYVDYSDYNHGFLLSTKGVYTTIDYPGAGWTTLSSVNDKGDIVGNATLFSGPSVAFRYNTHTKVFTKVSYPGAVNTALAAINNAGTMAGWIYTAKHVYTGFLLTAAGHGSKVAPPGATSSFVSGISTSGEAVGQYSKNGSSYNFAFRKNKYRNLTIPKTQQTTVYGINPAGTALVGEYMASQNVWAGFLYEHGTLHTLEYPEAPTTSAMSINTSGEIVGWYAPSASYTYGFIWTPPAAAR